MRCPVEVRIALRALGRHKLRTGLAMLGISIGVGAYICCVSLGAGAARQVQAQLTGLGDNLIQLEGGSHNFHGVRTGNRGRNTLLPADMKAIQEQIPLVTAVSANVDGHVQVVRGNQNWATHVRGVSPEYHSIRRWTVVHGTPFSPEDVIRSSKVCVIGRTIADQLFGDEDPLGQTILVSRVPCRVGGVLEPKGSSAHGDDQDDVLLMPYTTVQKYIRGIYWLDDIFASATSAEAIPAAEEQIVALMRERHHIQPGQDDDFNMRHPSAMLEAREETQRVMTMLLAGVASVALLVGGIGIMNIMLASVTERTQEIGIRLAVGARERDILLQFLVESITLSLVGATVGIGLGVAGSVALTYFAQWPTAVPPSAVGVAIAFAGTIGIFFGSFPATRAARLDPVEALGR